MPGDGLSPIWTNVQSDVASPSFPVNKDPHGATYDIVMSEKGTSLGVEGAGAHWQGTLLPPAIPRPDRRLDEFFSAISVLGEDAE